MQLTGIYKGVFTALPFFLNAQYRNRAFHIRCPVRHLTASGYRMFLQAASKFYHFVGGPTPSATAHFGIIQPCVFIAIVIFRQNTLKFRQKLHSQDNTHRNKKKDYSQIDAEKRRCWSLTKISVVSSAPACGKPVEEAWGEVFFCLTHLTTSGQWCNL